MSEYPEMTLGESLERLDALFADLFYAGLAYQVDDNPTMALRHATLFFALAAVYRHLGRPYPEPFASTSVHALTQMFLASSAEQQAQEGEADWPSTTEGPWLT